MKFEVSNRKHKKYMVEHNGKKIHFGDKRYHHYKDSTPLKKYSHLDHNDKDRRDRYLKRALKIRDKNDRLTKDNPNSANFYALRYLWGYKK